jgi:hypothetical protein
VTRAAVPATETNRPRSRKRSAFLRLLIAVIMTGFAIPATATQAGTIAAFYYPWFPETWGSGSPFTKYHPSLGFYNSGSPSVIQHHLRAMQYAGVTAGIASWWGQGTRTDSRIATILSTTRAMSTGFGWALYHEREGYGDPSVTEIASDLAYIKSRYAGDSAYLHIGGKPVIFVYGGENCAGAERWRAAGASTGFHVVLKVFSGYRACTGQPESWHQYAPAVPKDSQAGYSFAISPGFNKSGEAERLPRDLNRWKQDVAQMIASGAQWQLVTTFNEWGEGTAIESAQEWASVSGYGDYLDALHAATGGATPSGPGSDPEARGAGPRILTLSVSPRAFRAARSGPSVAAVGTTVRYSLSAAATVRFAVERARRKRQPRCLRQRRSASKRCIRYRGLKGSFTDHGKAGRNRVRFRGRLAGKRLRRGRYRLVATANDPAGKRGNSRRVRFRVDDRPRVSGP